MSEQQWKATFGDIKPLQLYKGQPSKVYSGHEIQILGQANMNVEYGHQRRQLPLLNVEEIKTLHCWDVANCLQSV